MGHGGTGRWGLRRVGVRYVLMLVLGVAGALVLAQQFHLGTAATAVTVLLSLASAYIAWEAYRADRAEAATVDLDAVAGQLAAAVRNQWDHEAAVRRVNDPYPLPVAWEAADDHLAEPWHLLADIARAWPGGPPCDPARWPQHAAGLAGRDAEIGEVFSDKVPTRRLVVLGEPGAGKSVLLIRLLQDLVVRRANHDPVPVLFSLASWNPRQPLRSWMAAQLRRTHPGLRAPVPAPVGPSATPANTPADLAGALLDAGRILPLLDGFDELPPALHAVALDALNRALPARQPLVLASRAASYRAVLTHPETMVRLNGAAVIQLSPLAPDAAALYLRRDAGGPDTPAAGRWDAVTTHLGTTSPVGQALSTPLGLFLARTLYNPRPHLRDTHAVTPHPDELCDATRFPDQDSLHAHLFDAYIPAAYSADSSDDARWTAERAERSLTFLARFLENQQGGSPNLAWWKIPHAVPAYLRRLTTMLMFGCVSGAALGIEVGLTGGPGSWFGLAGGLLSGTLAAFTVDPVPGTSLRWSPRRGAIAFLCGLASGFVIQARQVLEAEFEDGLGNGITLGLMAGIAFGLKPVTPDLSTVVGPATLLSSDRRTFITITLAGALAGGLAGVVSGPMVGADFPIGIVVPGVIGLAVGLGIGLTQTAWPHFVIARAHLGLRGELPRELIGFLKDAHEKRGVLRHVGAEYQFRHIDLQRHLAQRPPL